MAAGLCLSYDGGKTWRIERDGLHAHYCSAVAFAGDDVLVAASANHFAAEAALFYRRALVRPGVASLCNTGGLPRWLDVIVDTGNIAIRGQTIAVADLGGHLYVSVDGGRSWQCKAEGPPVPVSVFICTSVHSRPSEAIASAG
ncbi:MAG: WD40/YVTN/BNR-like repeat-containing protein [Acetobacteraceae bacterium]